MSEVTGGPGESKSAAKSTPSPIPGIGVGAGVASSTATLGAGPTSRVVPNGGVSVATSAASGKKSSAGAQQISAPISWDNILTGWPMRLTLAAAIVAVAVWTVIEPLPKTNQVQIVEAREDLNLVREHIAQQSSYASVDETQLSNLVQRAYEYLIPRREKLVGLTASVERYAKEQGLQADLTIKPVPEKDSPAPGVRIYSGILRLTPTAAKENSPYERLLGFLDRLEGIQEKVEVVSVVALAEKGRMGSAQVELQFWMKNEKPAAQ